MPRSLIALALILLSLTLVPIACIVKAQQDPAKKTPRIQIIPDMDTQPKYKAQSANPFFEDGRAMRHWPPGTVRRGGLESGMRLYHGLEPDSSFTAVFPLPVNDRLLARGQERYGIYCAPCHGLGGHGDGMVHRRAEALQQGTWTPPTDLTTQTAVDRPHGFIFDAITNGVRNMPAYGHQIPTDDRWAIVAYVRALQEAQDATIEDVPEPMREKLR